MCDMPSREVSDFITLHAIKPRAMETKRDLENRIHVLQKLVQYETFHDCECPLFATNVFDIGYENMGIILIIALLLGGILPFQNIGATSDLTLPYDGIYRPSVRLKFIIIAVIVLLDVLIPGWLCKR